MLGYLCPYVRSLETQVEKLEKERDELLNRLLHAYSGYELRQPVPSYAEVQQAQYKSPAGDEVIGRGVHATLDLLDELENETMRRSTGIADITVAAAREQAKEANEEAAQEYERNLVRARTAAAAESGIRDVV